MKRLTKAVSYLLLAVSLGSTGIFASFVPAEAAALPCQHCDLAGQDFSNLDLDGADFTGADLSNANFTNANLVGATFFKSQLSGAALDGANLEGADLHEGNLSAANLASANLKNSNLEMAWLDGANLDGTDLTGAKLSHINSGDAYGTPLLDETWKLVNGYLIGPLAELYMARLNGADLRDTNLSHADFFGADLRNALLSNAVLSFANFFRADLTGADFSGANLDDVHSGEVLGTPTLPPAWKTIRGYIVGPKADLGWAQLWGADLGNMDLRGTYLNSADLFYANLSRTNFEGANLSNVNLNSVNLDQVDLAHARLTGATGIRLTGTGLLPIGWSVVNGTLKYTMPVVDPPKTKPVASSKPSLIGTAKSTKTGKYKLTLNAGAWTGNPNPNLKYQWYQCAIRVPSPTSAPPAKCKKISGATSRTLAIKSAFKGKYLAASVTGSAVGVESTMWLTQSTRRVS